MGHSLKNWYKWSSLEDFDNWHNEIKITLGLPKPSIDKEGNELPDSIINSQYTECHKINDNDFRALVEEELADGLELSENPFPSNYEAQS